MLSLRLTILYFFYSAIIIESGGILFVIKPYVYVLVGTCSFYSRD